MSDICYFKITEARARLDGNNFEVDLHYPRHPKEITERLSGNVEFGAQTLQQVIETGEAEIASQEVPLHPAGGGSLIMLSDDVIVCHRRDKYAPVHKLYHSASSGFVNEREAIETEKGLHQNALRETAEETLLVTRDMERLVVTRDLRQYAVERARLLGLDLPIHEVREELVDPPDTLTVYDHDGSRIFQTRAFIDLIYDTSTSISALQVRRLNISSQEVLPIDAEGNLEDDGKFTHYDRESFMISRSQIENLGFGEPLENQVAYQTRFEKGKPIVYESSPDEYLGPGATPVTHPFLWAPEDLMSTCLEGLQVKGYPQRLGTELWKNQTLRDNPALGEAALIPPQYRRE